MGKTAATTATEATASETSAADATGNEPTPVLEVTERELSAARAENTKLRAQITELEGVLATSMSDAEELRRARDSALALATELGERNTELRAMREEQAVPSIKPAPTSAVSRFRARVRLGLSSGDVMPGDEFEAASEELQGLVAGEHFDVVG